MFYLCRKPNVVKIEKLPGNVEAAKATLKEQGYTSAIGPYKTRRAAEFKLLFGHNMP